MREILERALVANPDDVAAHAAYADYLAEQGDPRGEFVRVQLALEDESLTAAEWAALTARERELLSAHQRTWLSSLAPVLLDGTPPAAWRFRRGWLAAANNLRLDGRACVTLSAANTTRLLEELSIDAARGLSHLSGSPQLTNVRRLRLGHDPNTSPDPPGEFGSYVAEVVARMPRIEELRLFSRGVDARALFGLPTLAKLRRLDYHHGRDYPLEVLAANPALARLERLDLFPHAYDWADADGGEFSYLRNLDPGSYMPLRAVTALIHSPYLGRLTHLSLRCSNMGDAGLAALANSPMLGRLRVLDLSFGAVTDGGAVLLAGSGKTTRLDHLNLSYNALTWRGVNALRRAGVPLTADRQHDPDDDRYLHAGARL